MQTLSIGPLAFPLAPLLLLLAIAAASAVASLVAGRERATAAGNVIFHAAVAGLLAARLTYLAQHAAVYAATPLAAFDLRDGGWNASAGLIAGAAWLVWRGRRLPALRRALAGGAFAGAALWITASAATGLPDASKNLPALALNPLDGGAAVTLAQVAPGQPRVVNLWATWCPPCRAEMPMLAAAQQREKDVAFVFADQGESASAVHAYLTDQGLPLRNVLLDAKSALLREVGSAGLPTTLFYDAQGRLVAAHVGPLNAAALETRLRELRAGSGG
jgi:thiol-disulfide isomerase/thioredoxin